MAKAMIVSLGGTLAPLAHALNKIQPQYIIFFASAETKAQIERLRKGLTFSPQGTDQIITPSSQMIDVCYSTLVEQLPQKLQTWGIMPSDLVVDYTGGTKTMSASLVLATIEIGCTYSYVGGTERDKGGTGVVVNGKEQMLYTYNPWDRMAVFERKKANLLFNKARYTSALEVMADICVKVSEEKKPFYKMWADIIQAYDLWDRFQHKQAAHLFGKGLASLKLAAGNDRSLQGKAKEIEANTIFLGKLVNTQEEGLLVCDLLGNAIRRADLENKYDDAVARLYRAIEMAAQERLLRGYKIDASAVDPSKIPVSLRREYEQRYADRDGKIKASLYAGYRLLRDLGDPLGKRFFANYETEISPLLSLRNGSILAHGQQPVGRDNYERMLRAVTDFVPVEEAKIPRFPKLDI